MIARILHTLFPPKCVLCRTILENDETDLCHRCRIEAPVFTQSKIKLSFLAGWTCLWYYRGTVRQSLLRYKFYNHRSYADAYGRLLAMKLLSQNDFPFDILTWVPVSRLRKLRRGYDQVELLAKAVGRELQVTPLKTLRKIKNNPPQSRQRFAAARRANVMNVYEPVCPDKIAGKRILILDDILTTGATLSECAKVLLISGAKEVRAAAIAAASHEPQKQ